MQLVNLAHATGQTGKEHNTKSVPINVFLVSNIRQLEVHPTKGEKKGIFNEGFIFLMVDRPTYNYFYFPNHAGSLEVPKYTFCAISQSSLFLTPELLLDTVWPLKDITSREPLPWFSWTRRLRLGVLSLVWLPLHLADPKTRWCQIAWQDNSNTLSWTSRGSTNSWLVMHIPRLTIFL